MTNDRRPNARSKGPRLAVDNTASPAEVAISFLTMARPEGPWVLTFIEPDRPARSGTYGKVDLAQRLPEGLASPDIRKDNWYWVVAEVKDGVVLDGWVKAKKEQIARSLFLWADLDGRTRDENMLKLTVPELAKVGLPPPTFIVVSGATGCHPYWRLEEPFEIDGKPERWEEFERYLRFIAGQLHGDMKVCECSRIMRLPGNKNLPNADKRARGRTDPEETGLCGVTGLSYPLSAFRQAPARDTGTAGAAGRVKVPGKVEPVGDLLGILPQSDQAAIRALLVCGGDPDAAEAWRRAPQDWPEMSPSAFADWKRRNREWDRSRIMWHVLCECAREWPNVSDDDLIRLQLDPSLPLSGHQLKQPRPAQYAARQVERARLFSADFDKTDDDNIKKTPKNVRVALAKLGVRVSYDEFADRMPLEGLPGHEVVDDPAVVEMWALVQERFSFRPEKAFFTDMVTREARLNAFHPVLDYLDSLKWDGRPRIDRWLIDYAGAEDSEYVQAAGALILKAAVRRVRRPGAKFDEMLVLESPEGKNKSTALAGLAVREGWFTDDLPLNSNSKETIEALSGKWIVESADLTGMRKADVEKVKAMLSRTEDRARLAYGRLRTDRPRQCVFFGTTNNDEYLPGLTGNRRFWPVRVKQFDVARLLTDRDQLWAEAAAREAAGESIRMEERLWNAANLEQEQRTISDPWEDRIRWALGSRMGKVRSQDIWDLLEVPPKDRGAGTSGIRFGQVLRRSGWRRPSPKNKNITWGGRSANGWVRGEGNHEIRIEVARNRDGTTTIKVDGDALETRPKPAGDGQGGGGDGRDALF